MTFEVHRMIEESHPALAGHFPGNPIVPGVLIIEEVLQAARQWRGNLRLESVESVKFTSALKPGHRFSIKLREDGRTRIAFECWRDGTRLATGRLKMEPEAAKP